MNVGRSHADLDVLYFPQPYEKSISVEDDTCLRSHLCVGLNSAQIGVFAPSETSSEATHRPGLGWCQFRYFAEVRSDQQEYLASISGESFYPISPRDEHEKQ